MANEEHVAQLNRGVKVWNKWRKENPNIEPDLAGAQLSKMDLEGVNLFQTNLSLANLGGANLIEADLRGAVLNQGCSVIPPLGAWISQSES